MVLDPDLLYTQHYMVRIKGKVGQSRDLEKRPSQNLGVLAIEKGDFGSPSTTVSNFTYLLYICIYIYKDGVDIESTALGDHHFLVYAIIGSIIYIYIYIYVCVCVFTCIDREIDLCQSSLLIILACLILQLPNSNYLPTLLNWVMTFIRIRSKN